MAQRKYEQAVPMHHTNSAALRKDLDEYFKPLFAPHEEDGGVQLHVLRDHLIRHGATEDLSQNKIDYFIVQADQDENGRMNYKEFVSAVMADPHSDGGVLVRSHLTNWQKFKRAAVSSVVPRSQLRSHIHKEGDDELDGDYVAEYNCSPPPLFMIIITVIEVAVFIYYIFDLENNHDITTTADRGVPLYSPLIYNPTRRYEAWRYLTYMFLHQGYMHIIFNLIFQLVIGIPLEMVHKWWRVGLVYTLGVIAGAMAHSVTDTNTLLAGASGGCYALIGAHLAIVIMNWDDMMYDWMGGVLRFLLSGPVRLTLWLVLAVCDTGLAIYQRYYLEETTTVGYAAHFGGVLAGILVGIPVLRNIDEKPFEKVIWWIALVAYLALTIFAVFWNIFWPDYPATDWSACCGAPCFTGNC